jgi:hypothetical protein
MASQTKKCVSSPSLDILLYVLADRHNRRPLHLQKRKTKQNASFVSTQPSVCPSRACLAKRAAFSIQIDPDEKGFFPSHRVINRVGAAAGSVKQIGREHPEDIGRGLAIPVQYSSNVCICVAFRHGVVSLSVRGSAGVESVSV